MVETADSQELVGHFKMSSLKIVQETKFEHQIKPEIHHMCKLEAPLIVSSITKKIFAELSPKLIILPFFIQLSIVRK